MGLRKVQLPNGILYINDGDTHEAFFDEGGNPIKIPPRKAVFGGQMMGIPLAEYFTSPAIWDAQTRIKNTIKKKGEVVVAIDSRGVKKFGDQIMLTILPKAYRETYGARATVDVIIPDGYEEVWQNNPFVRDVTTELDERSKYDHVLDVTPLGLKFRRRDGDIKCADAILNGLGLTLINKTPVYILTEKEKEWAKKRFGDQKRPLIGVSMFSAVKSRTYPHMRETIKQLEAKGYNIIIVDNKIGDEFVFTFREAMAVVNECDLIITTDSAVLHMAGALKKRVISLHAYTEGHVFTESYEKAVPIQAPCPYGKPPCWWKIECLPGNDHLAKTNLDYAHCLKALKPEIVVEIAENQLRGKKKILVVMLTYNALAMTKQAVESIRCSHNYELLVVDNASTDGTIKWLKDQGIEFVSRRMSAAAAQNIGLKKFRDGQYDYIVILNNDIVMRYNCLDQLVKCAEASGAWGVMSTEAGPPLWAVDSKVPHDAKWDLIVDIPAGSYSCTLFTRKCVETVGLFNERFDPRYIEDNCYTLRLRAFGGTFVRAHAALFWHYLGGVVRNVEKDKKTEHDYNWIKNIEIYREMYGIHPHEPQDLNKLGAEWHKQDISVEKIETRIKHYGGASIRVERRMGGFGDILFTTVMAKALKQRFGKKCQIVYHIPKQLFPLLLHNPNIDNIVQFQMPSRHDFKIDLTDLEWRVEQQEMLKYGTIKSARTEIYLDLLGLKGDLKPDYFVTDEERAWAESAWTEPGNGKRIVIVLKGSNKLKIWPHMPKLIEKLRHEKKYAIQILDEGDQYRYPFRRAAALIYVADLVISPDTGISNLAAILGVPVITIFSNRNGANFTKMFKTMTAIQGDCPHREENYCDFFCPCLGTGPHRPKENQKVPDCMTRLKVETVYEMIKEILNE